MACDAEDCGFQILNDDDIVTSVQEESDPANDETDADDDNNNESRKGPSNADAFTNNNQSAVLLNYTAFQGNQRPCSDKAKVYNHATKNK
ncbi:hypothetical protein TNCV_1894011 [Trichonephila clavipes]|nr:hypothetical protein TNCV_1894011 [Trichonephila clavipes]